MTGEEKRRQLKEQYKRDLKMRKEFLEKAKSLRSQQNINKALGEMLDGLNDDSEDWINQINQETALTEAKFEMAMDEAAAAEEQIKNIANEAEMKRIQAESLVQQMKREMGLLEEEETTTEVEVSNEVEASTEATAGDAEDQEPPAPQPPRKTMGDF